MIEYIALKGFGTNIQMRTRICRLSFQGISQPRKSNSAAQVYSCVLKFLKSVNLDCNRVKVQRYLKYLCSISVNFSSINSKMISIEFLFNPKILQEESTISWIQIRSDAIQNVILRFVQ